MGVPVGRRLSVAEVVALLAARVAPLSAEAVPAVVAAGRVLATAVVSPVDVPGFDRAAMDGFAVRSADAGPRRLVGHSFPARPFAGVVGSGECVRIATGAPLPAGADAVLVIERAAVEGDIVTPAEAVPAGRHVGHVGEDVAAGSTILPAGRLLRPQDVGMLAAVGVPTVEVVRRPRVAVLVTGNELLPPGNVPTGFRIVDSNSPMLAALVERDGGIPFPTRYVADTFDGIRDAIRTAADAADVVLVSGGTSVGTEDHAPAAVASLGELAVHGVAVKPAGPTCLGFVPTPVFLLPGHPVSCLVGYDLFAGRVVRSLSGRSAELPYRRTTATLAVAVASQGGRVDYVRVRFADGRAVPLTAGASNLSSVVAADGFVLVPADRERVEAGEAVEVWEYE